jgi:hypothetical protein
MRLSRDQKDILKAAQIKDAVGGVSRYEYRTSSHLVCCGLLTPNGHHQLRITDAGSKALKSGEYSIA